MKKLILVFIILAAIIPDLPAEPMGHFHRSPQHHGHHHHHHGHSPISEEQKQVH